MLQTISFQNRDICNPSYTLSGDIRVQITLKESVSSLPATVFVFLHSFTISLTYYLSPY